MPSNTTIVEILWRYKKREELSEDEIAELQVWLRESPDHEKLFEELSNHTKWNREIEQWQLKDPDATWEKIRSRVESLSPHAFKEKTRTVWIRYISVAAACIILGIFIWTGERKPNKTKVTNTGIIHEILPAANKVTLTLGDGTLILLDTLKSAFIGKQNNTEIIKTDSAALIYRGTASSKSAKADYNILSTPRGSQYALVLPDGTKVWLNALSTLRFPVSFEGALRKVELTGEAYFEVSANKNRPFVVQTSGSMAIKVLGTHFNINAYKNEPVAKAELLSGLILASNERDSALIKPGQEVQIKEKGKLEITNANLEQSIAWRNKIFWYRNASFDEIMRQLARWYDMEIIYRGQINQSYTGILPTNLPLSNVLKILEKSGNIHFTIGEGNKVTVSP